MQRISRNDIVDGLKAIGGLSDAYTRTKNIISDIKIVNIGISFTFKHPKAPAGFMSSEVVLWDDIEQIQDAENFFIDVFMKHAKIVLEKAQLPFPLIRPSKR